MERNTFKKQPGFIGLAAGIVAVTSLVLLSSCGSSVRDVQKPVSTDLAQGIESPASLDYYETAGKFTQALASVASENVAENLESLEHFVQSNYGLEIKFNPMEHQDTRAAEIPLVELLGASTSCAPEAVAFMAKTENLLKGTNFTSEKDLFLALSNIDAEALSVLQDESLVQYLTFSETLTSSLHYWLDSEQSGIAQMRGWWDVTLRVLGTAVTTALTAASVGSTAGPVSGIIAGICAGYTYWKTGESVSVASVRNN